MEIPCSCRGSLKVSFSWICRAIYFKISVYAVSEQNNCQSFSWTFVLQFRTSDKSRKFQMPEILTVLKFECLLGLTLNIFGTHKTGIISLKLEHLMIFCKFLVLHLPQVFWSLHDAKNSNTRLITVLLLLSV
jgi:hypothetical protein